MWSNLKRPHARVFVAAVYITLKCWKEARQLEGRLGPPVTINPSTHWAPACQFGITMQTVCVSGIESALATTKRRSRGPNLSTLHHIFWLLSQQTFSKRCKHCTAAPPTHSANSPSLRSTAIHPLTHWSRAPATSICPHPGMVLGHPVQLPCSI